MPAFLDAALALAARGFKVFPVAPKTKNKPLTAHGFKDASNDESVIRRWWEATPDANIAIATGRMSGVIVLDADEGDVLDKDGKFERKKVGFQSLRQLQSENGELSSKVDAYTLHYLAGHTDWKTTARYVHIGAERLKAILR